MAILGLAGCTTSTAGTASPTNTMATEPSGSNDPTPSDSSPPGSGVETDDAPRVDNPLDAGDLLTNPCAALSQTQLAGFGVQRTGEPDTDSEIAKYVGPSCIWSAAEVDSSISVTWITGNKNGLSDTFRIRDRWAYFEETTVAGYPAVFNGQTDARAQGTCGLTAGVSNTLSFAALEQGRLDARGACDRAKQVAAAVIQNLRGN